MSADLLRMRPVAPHDAYALWLWANDEATRAASFGRALIPWADHVRWLGRALTDPGQVHLVAELEDGLPVGAIRFESADGWQTARLSYVIAPEARGRGLSGPLVRSGVRWVRGSKAGVSIWATVMRANARSLRVFRNGGWEETADGEGASRFWLLDEETDESDRH